MGLIPKNIKHPEFNLQGCFMHNIIRPITWVDYNPALFPGQDIVGESFLPTPGPSHGRGEILFRSFGRYKPAKTT